MMFCCKLWDSATETVEMLTAALSKPVVGKHKFLCGLQVQNMGELDYAERPRRRSTRETVESVDRVKEFVEVSLSMRLVTCWKVQLAQFLTF
jgi:hypothetical protein